MQGLVVVPLFAGYDLRRKQGRIWKFDVTGGRYEEAEFEATGSGGLYARESLKKSHHARASTRDEALEMAVAGAHRRRRRGPRHGRHRHACAGIFPTVIFCSEPGIEQRARRRDRATVYESILARRANGRNGAAS